MDYNHCGHIVLRYKKEEIVNINEKHIDYLVKLSHFGRGNRVSIWLLCIKNKRETKGTKTSNLIRYRY